MCVVCLLPYSVSGNVQDILTASHICIQKCKDIFASYCTRLACLQSVFVVVCAFVRVHLLVCYVFVCMLFMFLCMCIFLLLICVSFTIQCVTKCCLVPLASSNTPSHCHLCLWIRACSATQPHCIRISVSQFVKFSKLGFTKLWPRHRSPSLTHASSTPRAKQTSGRNVVYSLLFRRFRASAPTTAEQEDEVCVELGR